jgi:uroporphyrinogen-III synthase
MRGRVLVTRPEPGASRTARRLAERGFEPVVLPLTEIRPLPLRHIPDSGSADAVAVTSANAIRHAPQELISTLGDKPLFAVGGETARAARSAGFAAVFEGPGNAARLAREMIGRLQAGSRVLYLCGRVRREEFEATLAGTGLAIDAVETYDTVVISHATDFLASTLGSKPIGSALVLSAVAADALSALVTRADLGHLFENTRYFCISNRTATILEARHRGHVYVAAMPDEDALISLLERES